MWSEVLTNLVVEYSLFQPICEILHFLGLAMLVGVVGMLDLRMLGLGKGVSVAAIHRLLPWALAGFGLCAITGYIFVAGDPFKSPMQFFDNLAFRLKMLFVALAGLNALAFYVTGLSKKLEAMGPSDDAPTGAKVIAATSLVLWVGVMYFGRMLPWSDALYMLFEDPSQYGL
jgi:hypothetical protein